MTLPKLAVVLLLLAVFTLGGCGVRWYGSSAPSAADRPETVDAILIAPFRPLQFAKREPVLQPVPANPPADIRLTLEVGEILREEFRKRIASMKPGTPRFALWEPDAPLPSGQSLRIFPYIQYVERDGFKLLDYEMWSFNRQDTVVDHGYGDFIPRDLTKNAATSRQAYLEAEADRLFQAILEEFSE